MSTMPEFENETDRDLVDVLRRAERSTRYRGYLAIGVIAIVVVALYSVMINFGDFMGLYF